MLLHRFPIKVTDSDSTSPTQGSMSILVSLYRKNVDTNYQQLVCRQISEGKLDRYVCMMIICLVNNGKQSVIVILSSCFFKPDPIHDNELFQVHLRPPQRNISRPPQLTSQ